MIAVEHAGDVRVVGEAARDREGVEDLQAAGCDPGALPRSGRIGDGVAELELADELDNHGAALVDGGERALPGRVDGAAQRERAVRIRHGFRDLGDRGYADQVAAVEGVGSVVEVDARQQVGAGHRVRHGAGDLGSGVGPVFPVVAAPAHRAAPEAGDRVAVVLAPGRPGVAAGGGGRDRFERTRPRRDRHLGLVRVDLERLPRARVGGAIDPRRLDADVVVARGDRVDGAAPGAVEGDADVAPRREPLAVRGAEVDVSQRGSRARESHTAGLERGVGRRRADRGCLRAAARDRDLVGAADLLLAGEGLRGDGVVAEQQIDVARPIGLVVLQPAGVAGAHDDAVVRGRDLDVAARPAPVRDGAADRRRAAGRGRAVAGRDDDRRVGSGHGGGRGSEHDDRDREQRRDEADGATMR